MEKFFIETEFKSIAEMGRCENVATDGLLRICEALDCQLGDIVERVPLKQESNE